MCISVPLNFDLKDVTYLFMLHLPLYQSLRTFIFFFVVVLFGILDFFRMLQLAIFYCDWCWLLKCFFVGNYHYRWNEKFKKIVDLQNRKKFVCLCTYVDLQFFWYQQKIEVFSLFLYIFRLIERILDFWLQNLCVACRSVCKPTSLLKLQTFCNNCFCMFTYYLSLDLNYLNVVGYENCSKSHVFLKCVAIVRKN